MPYETLRIIPSVDIERTPSDNAAGINESSFIRWRDKIPEKRGGWSKYINFTFSGTPRDLLSWQGLNEDRRLGVGTTSRLYVLNSGDIKDITPQKTSVNIAVNLTTTLGSNQVLVTDTGRGATIYDTVVFKTPVSVGGIVLSGAYDITTTAGSNAYYVTAAINATSAVSNAGDVPSFTTTSGAIKVTVTLADHTYAAGDIAAFPIATTGNGVTIYGQYLVTSVLSSSTFTINASTEATANGSFDMNGGDLGLDYYITQGPTVSGTGYGVGGYGSGGYGTGSPAPASSGTPITVSDYWLSNWGEILVASVADGPVFTWSTTTGYNNCKIVSNAPLANAGSFVAMPQQMLMCWGSTYNGVADPLQIRWSDAENFEIWTPTSINQAGGYHIPTGSKIVRGIQGANLTYWFTDVDVYAAQYIGPPYVWGFNKISTGCGLIAPKAIAGLGSNLYWMSQKQFFVIGPGGGAQPIPCSVWDYVFQNINAAHTDNVRAAANSQFNEVTWYFPSSASNSGENDSYITYNTLYNEWDFGSLNRCAWIDQSVLGAPIGADSNGVVYQHETSNDADGAPIASSFKTGYFSLANGNDLVFVDRMIPDMVWGAYSDEKDAQIKITFNVTDYPGLTPTTYGPYTVTKQTPYIEPRFRGRYVQIEVASDDLGSFWRLGSIRYRFASDGRR